MKEKLLQELKQLNKDIKKTTNDDMLRQLHARRGVVKAMLIAYK